MPHKKEFGECVRSIRKKLNISQEQLCRDVDIDQSNLCNIEQGKKNVTIDTIEKIAKGLKVEIKTLFDK